MAIDNVNFLLIPEVSGVSWVVAGQTGSSGEGTVLTSLGTYSGKGCPEGKFKVVLNRSQLTGLELTEEESRKLSQEESDAHAAKVAEARRKQPKIIPAAFMSSASQPVTIDVAKDTEKIVFELSKHR